MKFLRKLFGLSNTNVSDITSVEQKEHGSENIRLEENERQLCLQHGLDISDAAFLKTQTGEAIEVFHYEPEYDEKDEEPVFLRSRTTRANAKRIINDYFEIFQAKGKLLFFADDWITEEVIGIFPYTANAFEVMEYAGTNGINSDITTEDIINKIKEWKSKFRLRVIGIGLDSCKIEILDRNIDYKSLATDVYAFCPDVADEHQWSIAQLAEDIETTGIIQLWWD